MGDEIYLCNKANNNCNAFIVAWMKQSISAELWDKNLNFLTQLRAKIAKHPVSHHPAIETLNNGEINKENLKRIHLEYRHAMYKAVGTRVKSSGNEILVIIDDPE
ncbi:hypothetical protein MNL92_20440 [Acinetobacter baumannii]|uniref:hypothetical protein n=1 Tax=Acinetobacter baumannii TaxID=470 RepID=UPI00223C4EF1|nr:hypothetical protein [Acinetobacter baumannii]MCT2464660.1 hypothetical protein [Acinetobacter baumannii]